MEEPNIAQKATNLAGAMVNWATKDGFTKVTPDIFAERKAICTACEFWDKDGYNGIGKCKMCGCSVGKLYIPSSKCPLNPPKWNPISV